MKRFLATIFIIAFTFIVFGQNRQKLTNTTDFENNLKAVSEKTHSVESEFRQEKYMKAFSDKVVSYGTFYYLEPNKIRLQYQKPITYSIIINGDKIQTVSGQTKNTINLGSNKMMAQMRGLIEASMVGNISALSKDYELQYFQSVTDYFVKITPVNKSIKAYIKEIVITFDRTSMAVTQLRMTENNDDYTDYFFTNQKYNGLKNDEKFRIR